MTEAPLATNTLTFIRTIEDWFGSSYNPEDGKFYEKNDYGIVPNVCDRSMDALRGARFASVLLPSQKTVDAMEAHHEAHEIALETAGIGLKELHGRVAGHQAMIALFFAMGAWVIWGENDILKWVCVLTAFGSLGAAIYNLMKSRARWAYLLLMGAIEVIDQQRLESVINEVPATQNTTGEDAGQDAPSSDQKADLQDPRP